jgi:hypothetical protein
MWTRRPHAFVASGRLSPVRFNVTGASASESDRAALTAVVVEREPTVQRLLAFEGFVRMGTVGQKQPYGLGAIKQASANHTANVSLRYCLSRRLQISMYG